MQLLKTLGATKKAPAKPKQYVDQNPIEAIMSIGSGVKSSMVDDLGKASAIDIKEQVLGIEASESHSKGGGDLSEGAELNLAEFKNEVHQITEQGRDFAAEIIHAGKRAHSENSQEIQVKMQEIIIELKQLSRTTKEIQTQVSVMSIEQTDKEYGVYHLNAIEKMLSFLRDLRINAQDSLAWFSALRSKKAARQYGSMAKKHGTTFTLSNERTVATQVG